VPQRTGPYFARWEIFIFIFKCFFVFICTHCLPQSVSSGTLFKGPKSRIFRGASWSGECHPIGYSGFQASVEFRFKPRQISPTNPTWHPLRIKFPIEISKIPNNSFSIKSQLKSDNEFDNIRWWSLCALFEPRLIRRGY
jgi:hypothetical protein